MKRKIKSNEFSGTFKNDPRKIQYLCGLEGHKFPKSSWKKEIRISRFDENGNIYLTSEYEVWARKCQACGVIEETEFKPSEVYEAEEKAANNIIIRTLTLELKPGKQARI